MDKWCICKHDQSVHKHYPIRNANISSLYCLGCAMDELNFKNDFPPLHNFKLDNLKLVEQLAKQKKLI